MCPRSTRNTPQICSRARARCGSSQRGACRRPLLSGNCRWASALEGELGEQVVGWPPVSPSSQPRGKDREGMDREGTGEPFKHARQAQTLTDMARRG